MTTTAKTAILVLAFWSSTLAAAEEEAAFTAHSHNKKVVCYWGTWASYRHKAGQFTVDDLDPNLCTHIVYAFAGLDESTSKIKSLDAWLDLGDGQYTGKQYFKRATEKKLENPDLKVTLAVGGWTEGSIKYSIMAKDRSKRKIFVESVVDMLSKYGFDGLDLDWEYPGKRGGVPADKNNLVSLIKELKAAFASHEFTLTAAISAGPETIETSYDVAQIYEHLDLVHVMSYDYHGAWDRKTGHHAPLRAKPNATGNDLAFTVENTWKTLLAKGAKAEKTVLGVPFYGRTFNLVNPNDHGMGARARQDGFAGPYTQQNGFMGYNEICEKLADESETWTTEWDADAQAPFAYSGRKWVCYDDPKSIGKKVEFANEKGLAGIMMWSVETDDFTGKCGPKNPLLTTINRVLTEGHDAAAGSGAISFSPLTVFAAAAAIVILSKSRT